MQTTISSLHTQLIGAWTLIRFELENKEGEISYPLGIQAQGSLYYLPGGQVAVNIMQAARTPLVDPLLYKHQKLRYDQLGYLAYSGHYALSENDRIITHHITLSLYPEWVGKPQRRVITLNGDVLQLSSDGPVGPDQFLFRLQWQRS